MYIPKWIGIDEDNIPEWFIELIKNKNNRIVGKGDYECAPLVWNTIYLTTKCTRKCQGCSTNYITKDKKDMTDETLNRLCEWIPETYYNHNKLVSWVIFLGGEPLLVTDKIKKIMDNVHLKTPGMLGQVFTNGDLLDKTNWNDLEHIQSLCLNTTDIDLIEIKRRIEMIEAKGLQPGLSTVLDEGSFSKVNDILIYAIENNVITLFYRDIFRGNDFKYIDNVLFKLHELCDILEKYKLKGYKIKTDQFYSLFMPRINDRQHTPICGNNTFGISPDGSISCCIRGLYNNESKIGTIWDKNIYEQGNSCKRLWERKHDNVGHDDECLSCSVKYSCGGGCTFARFANTGTLIGKYPFCKINKEIYTRLEELHDYN